MFAGTSWAAPHVTGVGALVRAVNPALTNAQTMLVMTKRGRRPRPARGRDERYGFGALDAEAAVLAPGRCGPRRRRRASARSSTSSSTTPTGPVHVYQLVPSRKGWQPGLPLALLDPQDSRTLPVTPDPDLHQWLAHHPGPEWLTHLSGTLDAAGRAVATFRAPPALAGTDSMTFAFLTFDPQDPHRPQVVSNPVEIRLLPHAE